MIAIPAEVFDSVKMTHKRKNTSRYMRACARPYREVFRPFMRHLNTINGLSSDQHHRWIIHGSPSALRARARVVAFAGEPHKARSVTEPLLVNALASRQNALAEPVYRR
jgi:hypothetical protein